MSNSNDLIPYNDQNDETRLQVLSYIEKKAHYFKDRFIAKLLKHKIYLKKIKRLGSVKDKN